PLLWPPRGTQQTELAARYQPFFLAARLCHDLREGTRHGHKTFLGDPMEIALVDMARQVLPGDGAYHLVDEIPFDATRMRLSMIYAMPAGLTLYTKGGARGVGPPVHAQTHRGDRTAVR